MAPQVRPRAHKEKGLNVPFLLLVCLGALNLAGAEVCGAGRYCSGEDFWGNNVCEDCSQWDGMVDNIVIFVIGSLYCPGQTPETFGNYCWGVEQDRYKDNNAPVISCPRNAISSEDFTTCTFCDPGYYVHGIFEECRPCTAGKYLNYDNSCLDCPRGKFSGEGASDCTDCAAGTWSGWGMSYCYLCRTGETTYYSQGDCRPCERGKYAESSTSACIICGAGKYSEGSVDACVLCDFGKAIEDDGQTTTEHDNPYDCKFCDAGKSATNDRSSCLNCPKGTYWNGNSVYFYACSICPPGKYRTASDSSDGIECRVCPAGRYNDDQATSPDAHDEVSDCSICPAGEREGRGCVCFMSSSVATEREETNTPPRHKHTPARSRAL